jgi:hypothetical protein
MKSLWTPGLGRYLLGHPANAVTLARAGWRLRGDGWLSHAPFLPLPDTNYWNFRVVTVNGSSDVTLSTASMVDAAKWALAQPVGRSA